MGSQKTENRKILEYMMQKLYAADKYEEIVEAVNNGATIHDIKEIINKDDKRQDYFV